MTDPSVPQLCRKEAIRLLALKREPHDDTLTDTAMRELLRAAEELPQDAALTLWTDSLKLLHETLPTLIATHLLFLADQAEK